MKLKKGIGEKTLIFLAVNSIIGASIYFLPAIGAAYSGSASILAWIAMSAISVIISFYFAELVSICPKAGGVYDYTKKAFGEFAAFLVGWVAWMLANFTIAIETVGSMMYVLPDSVFVIPLSLFFIILFNYISYRGIDYSSRTVMFFSAATIFSLLVIIMPGLPAMRMENFFPFSFSLPLIFLSMYFISDTFAGWESATYLAEEVKNAKRVMPKALVISTIIVSLLVTALAIVSLGVVNWKDMDPDSPLTSIASKIFGSGFGSIFSAIVFIPMIGTAAGWIVASPRLLYAMSRDKVLTSKFSAIHRKYRTPYYAIIFQAAVASVITIIASGNFHTLLSMMIPLEIIVYSAVLLIVLRFRSRGIRGEFTSPFGGDTAILLLIFNALLMLAWLEQVSDALSLLLMSLFLVSFGAPLYILIKLRTDKHFIEKFFDSVSFAWERLFGIWYGEKEIKSVIDRIEPRKGSVILDFGCGTGTTTLQLAKRLGAHGTIVAIDISSAQLNRAFRKIEKAMKISNVIFIKEHQMQFSPESFDAVVSAGVLEHLDKPEETLRKIFSHLKKGGQFSFFSFGKSFGIPAAEFVESKEAAEKLFASIGIKPNIRIEKRKFTEYIYIWGRKPRNWTAEV